jgi:4-hydroxymandelate oxidase
MPTEKPPSFPSLSALEQEASTRVSPRIWAYIEGGSGEERAVEGNRDAFRRWRLRPRVLGDVSTVDLGTTLLGTPVHAPFFVAPTAYQGEIHADGETGTARAAAGLGILGVYSTLSSASLEAIASAAGAGPRWFQLYLQPEFEQSRRLVERAGHAGYSAIVVTADVPVLAVRDRQAHGGFAIDGSIPLGNGPDVTPPPRAPNREGARYTLRSEAASTWEILDRLRGVTELPLVVKGVLTAEDAREAVQHGARGILVSNHGGRQLDAARPSLMALPEVVAAVDGKAEVYLDGGVRRGVDILIALALGARAVGLGRPVLWALAWGGSEGVSRYLSALGTELATSMALAGRRAISEIDSSLVEPNPPLRIHP